MPGFNLPPGCSVSDIPGNSSEDAAWDKLFEDIGASGLTADEARRHWDSQPLLLKLAKKARKAMLWAQTEWTDSELKLIHDLESAIREVTE